MVFLSRIYTKTGDQGQTGLGDGTRVSKDDPRVAAYGSVDELNSVLGLLASEEAAQVSPWKELLRGIQNDLFDVGADLCLPQQAGEPEGKHLRIQTGQAERLEKAIDQFNEGLSPLRSFVLPGGRRVAAWCHLARTVCRRAERDLVTLMRQEKINTQALIYLNRLSDLLFVLARVWNDQGSNDVLWSPGAQVEKKREDG